MGVYPCGSSPYVVLIFTQMKNKISALKRKIKALEKKHSKVYVQGFFNTGGNMNAVRFQLSIIQEQIMFAERELRDLQENL